MVAVSLGVRSLVWVEDPDEAWIDGEVIGVTGEDFKVASTSGKTVVAKSSNVYPKDAEAPPCGVDDMTKLAYLHEPAVNGVMINEGISQSILINGESGAGKTESTKQLMRYLAYMGGRASTDGRSVEQKVHLGTIEFTKGKEMDSSTPKDEKSWFHLKTAAELFMEMHPEKVVVDISSDDEDDDHKWLTKLLDGDDGVNDNDDEVIMVVNENKKNVVKNLKMKLKDKDCLLVDELKDIDDDECLVLENDPNEKLEVKADGGESKKGGVNEDEDDEIVIISEKGQVACRDYPHSRHLCINFLFSTTPNQSHCEQCYCYVCDSPAPCVYWGNGSATTNHCHATDKDGIWRLARENARNVSKGVQPVKRLLPVDPQRLEPAMVQPQNPITRASLINPKKVVVDISSDDEDDDHKWLTKLLGDDDVNNDDDEVIMVVNENEKNVVKNLKVKLKVEDCLLVDNIKEIDDDDKCVVLENDPNEKLEVKDDGGESKKGSVNEDDEIVIISEKGQVACRDYPHSRHLCINFPFSTTPSQSHCKQCYCYVCDSLAPCVYWGNGCATTDHCHATYKDSIWRLARESARNVSIGTQPVQRHLPVDPQNLAPDMVQPQNLITRPNLIPGPRASPNFRPPDEVPNACHKTQVVSNNKGKWNDEVQCKVKVKMDIITLKTREMDPKKVVVDNSSDDDHKWLTKLLLDDDDDDDDEVILVVNENEKNVVKNLRVKLKAEDCLLVDIKDIDDDKCLVLENDPNEKLEVKDDGGESKKRGINEDEDDEIVISEKGQILKLHDADEALVVCEIGHVKVTTQVIVGYWF